ncbi:MAG: AI-2E family transporter [bacterium]|nr:AI-2E family transporter [bacterium]MDE0239354.1 AI-2E family transporter [bacterium]MDE0419211.1 AI-2E family transporter [bacterium]
MGLPAIVLWAAVTGFSLWLVVEGRALILPFVVAVVLWYLIATLRQVYARVRGSPGWLTLLLAVATVIALVAVLVELTLANVNAVVDAAPLYQANLVRHFGDAAAFFGIAELPTIGEIRNRVDLAGLVTSLASGMATFVGNVGIVLIYLAFLLVEQGHAGSKLDALLGGNAGRIARVRHVISRINADIRTYLWVKTLLSVVTGAVSWIVMKAVGLDLAEFWAVLIFFLNFIPTIGSILGIVFPALLTLAQFAEPLAPFVMVTALLGATQIVTGNVIEPRMMGRTLKLSPLVILLSLALWGSLWGVIGMFLSVPITVISLIVFAQFRQTRPIAILLSDDGNIAHLEDDSGEGGHTE